MFGFSVFLSDTITDQTIHYMEQMVRSGFRGIFTSIHIPEDDSSKYLSGLQKLGAFAKQHEIELVADISGSALERLGYSLDTVSELREMGLTGIRIDFGIPMSTVAQLSHQLTVALNASTISERDLEELRTNNANFQNMEAWHNYYPRPETALDESDFEKQNKWLKDAGFQVMAFVPGDEKLRGPLFEGLPTLEKHRYLHPLGSALEMQRAYAVDKVFIGDPTITDRTIEQFAMYEKENVILFHATALVDPTSEQGQRVAGRHQNRMDSARDVVRSAHSRVMGEYKPIPKDLTMIRSIGTITVDNEGYGRYAGEIQITKRNLPEDDRVNVLGRIDEREVSLLAFCGPGQSFEIQWEEKKEWI